MLQPVGESAGGQLVTLAAGSEQHLAGVVSLYGVYDIEQVAGNPSDPRSLARRLFGFTSLDATAIATLRAFSPIRHAAGTLPPMLLVAGTADRLLAQQRAYAEALGSAGARVEPWPGRSRYTRGSVVTAEIADAPHGIEAWHEPTPWRMWEVHVGDWLRFLVQRPN